MIGRREQKLSDRLDSARKQLKQAEKELEAAEKAMLEFLINDKPREASDG